MLKQYLSIFFVTLFIATAITPSVLVFVDDTINVSFLLDSSEEEGEKGKENNKELEVFIISNDLDSDDLFLSKTENNLQYTYKKYSKPHINLISPPPEFIL